MSKAIRFKNNTYLDTSGIVHNKQNLQSILNNYLGRNIIEYKKLPSTNFNDFYTPGLYSLGTQYANAPYSSHLYGILIVLTNDGRTWQKTDNSSWLCQIVIDTSGRIYMRRGINSNVPEGWQQLH